MAERSEQEYGLDDQMLQQELAQTQPVGPGVDMDAAAAEARTAFQTPAGTSGGRRGSFNNMMLDMPTQRGGSASAPWEGFNTERAAAGGDPKSVKDAFYRFGQSMNFDPRGKSKEEAEAYMRSQIDSARNYGLDILDVDRDQFFARTAEAPEGQWIDWIRNSGGGDDQAIQWAAMSGPGSGDGSTMGGGMVGMGGVGGVDSLINADLSSILQQAQQLTDGGDIDPALLQQMLGQEMR